MGRLAGFSAGEVICLTRRDAASYSTSSWIKYRGILGALNKQAFPSTSGQSGGWIIKGSNVTVYGETHTIISTL